MEIKEGSNFSLKDSFVYGSPAIGAGYMYLLMSIYVMKFATDILLIAPAVVGLIFSVSRVWDAINDPLVGYLSDKTKWALGRRRSWLLMSIIPISVFYLMVFFPPQGVSSNLLTLWVALSIIGFYTSMTIFVVPHLSLGAELSSDYHERSKIFGVRHFFYTIGSAVSLISFYFFIMAEQNDLNSLRDIIFNHSMIAVIITAILILLSVYKLREKSDYNRKEISNPYRAYKDVWENKHARLLIIATFIEHIGSAAIAVLTLYVAQYIVGSAQWAPLFILSYLLPSALSVPLWIPLSIRFGKIKLWIASKILAGISFGSMFSILFIEDINIKIIYVLIAAFFAGLANGCGSTLGPSIQADVIDYDELQTGERKEGSYFAAWSFIYKTSAGVMLMLTGFSLQISGFIPNQDQVFEVKLVLATLYCLFPLVCYFIGAFILTKFELNEEKCKVIRETLDSRGKLEV